MLRVSVFVCLTYLLVVIPPVLGLFAALSWGFGGRVHVEPGQGYKLNSREGIWKDSFWKDLYFGLSDPGGEKQRETMTKAEEQQRGKEGSVKEGSRSQMKPSR